MGGSGQRGPAGGRERGEGGGRRRTGGTRPRKFVRGAGSVRRGGFVALYAYRDRPEDIVSSIALLTVHHDGNGASGAIAPIGPEGGAIGEEVRVLRQGEMLDEGRGLGLHGDGHHHAGVCAWEGGGGG